MLENLSQLIFLVQGFRFCEVNNANVISPNYFGQLTGQMFKSLPYITFNISISPSLKKCITLKLYEHFYFYISILFSALSFIFFEHLSSHLTEKWSLFRDLLGLMV